MYLPKHQFTQISVADLLQNAAGDFLADAVGNLLNKSEITLTSAGEFYDVPPSDLEKGIFTNATQYYLPQQTPPAPDNAFVEPTDQDKKNCKFERYFTKNKATGKIKELSKSDYQSSRLNGKNYELFAKTDWIVCGPLPDQVINGYFLEGTESKNRKLVDELEKQIPGIQDVLTDYGQFVTDTTPPAPAPAPKTKITIPAPSKRL